jgi:hypothetical protein
MSIEYQLEIFSKYPSQALLSKLIISIRKEYGIELHIASKSSVNDINRLINDMLKNPNKYPKYVESYITEEKFELSVDDIRIMTSNELFNHLIKTKQINMSTGDIVITNIEETGDENKSDSETSDSSDSSNNEDSDSEDEDTESEATELVEVDIDAEDIEEDSISDSDESVDYE